MIICMAMGGVGYKHTWPNNGRIFLNDEEIFIF